MSEAAEPQVEESAKTTIRLSYSRVAKYINCTAQFKYHYIDKIRAPAGEPLYIGDVIHQFIEMVNKEGNGGFTQEQIDELIDTIAEQEKAKYTFETQYGMLLRQMKEMANFWYNTIDRIRDIRNPEQHILVPLINPKTGDIVEGVELEAYIDGFVDDNHIIDYKTSRGEWEQGKHKREIQPKFYALALGVGIDRGSLDFTHEIITKTKVPKLQRLTQTLTPKDAMTAFHICRAYLSWLSTGIFVPNRGLHCQWCDHLSRCVEDY
jgi:hypothetical protein